MVAIWPYLKQYERKKMIWPFGHFLAFFECRRKLYILKPVLEKSEQ